MLSRTANNLYWIARYMERADTSVRALEVGSRIALIPTAEGYHSEWDSLLLASGTNDAFRAKYGAMEPGDLINWFVFDRDNPSSVAHCVSAARESGRIIRTALTTQVWDALNGAYQDLRQFERSDRRSLDQSTLIDWVLRQSALLRGAIDATLLRDDGYGFLNIGYHLERADNTARLMDVKYYVLLPRVEFVGSGLDNYQWSTLLRAMGAQRAFHWAYGGEVTAAKIADFFILNPQSPRSLITCISGAAQHLSHLAKAYGRDTDAQYRIRAMKAELETETVERIFDEGLHEYLLRFIANVADVGNIIHNTYLGGDML